MKRAIKISIKFITAAKQRQLDALLVAYRAAVNFYIKSLWNKPGKLDKPTLAKLQHTRLSERYKSQALKQALSIVVTTRKAAKKTKRRASLPKFKGGACLDGKFIKIENGNGCFDLMVKMSVLNKGKRIWLPCKKTKIFNKWMSKPLAKVIQGCELRDHYIILWIDLPDLPCNSVGKPLGIDIGVNKLITDSEGKQYGTDFKNIRDKILKRKRGSKSRCRVFRERDNFLHRVINQLPWDEINVLGIECLKDLKKGKKRNRGKSFRKAMAPWTYRQVIEILRQKSQENRVHLVEVESAYTSRTCPKCNKESKDNRKGENFVCIVCHYSQDADYVGAHNILVRTLATLGSVESPKPLKAVG